MAMNANTVGYGQGSGLNQSGVTVKPDAYFDKMLLKMLRQMDFKFAKYATEKSLPKNFGDTINWRRFEKLDVTKTPLTEGVAPDGQTVSGSSITATIAQYGNVMYFTDVIDLIQLDKVRQEYTVELGYQAKETLDEIVRDVLVAEGSIQGSASGVAKTNPYDVTDYVAVDEFRKAILNMKRNYVSGNRKAKGKYVALIAPEIMFALFDDRRVQDYMSFGQTNGMFSDGNVVDMFGIKFEEVLNAPFIMNGASTPVPVYDSIIIGEEAYATTKLEGAGLRVITKGLGSAGVEDPLDQLQSIGWKITGFGAKVLRSEAIVNYWSTAQYDPDGNGIDTQVPKDANAKAANQGLSSFTVTFAAATGSDTVTLTTDEVTMYPGQTIAQAVAGTSLTTLQKATSAYYTDLAATDELALTAEFGDNVGFDDSYDKLMAQDITVYVKYTEA